MALARLEPAAALDALSPAKSAFMARTDLAETRGLGYTAFNLDAVTALLLGILGKMPTIRHVSGVSEPILEFFSDAGLVIEETIIRYEKAGEAEAAAQRLVETGHKLFWPYPLRAGCFSDAAHLVPPSLWRFLNAKKNLGALVPPGHLAEQQFWRFGAGEAVGYSRPCYVKASGGIATGWGYMVRHCANAQAFDEALAYFKAQDGIDEVLIEQAVDIVTCWCANIFISDDKTIYLGAAEQIFSAPGKQAGSMIDPHVALSAAGQSLVVAVGEAARKLGYRGAAGIDIGISRDGGLYVFDPNFRFASSTTQVLLHPSASSRAGLEVSLSFQASGNVSLKRLLGALRGALDDGWFVPTRLIDGDLLPAAQGKASCNGFVLGRDRADAESRAVELAARVAAA